MAEWHTLPPFETDDSKESSRLWKELDKSAEAVGKIIANTSPATMPTLDHSSMADYGNVYEPSDDTYLLIDAIKHDLFSGYPGDSNKDDETINRTALDCYYRLAREKPDNDDDDDDERKILGDLLVREGKGEAGSLAAKKIVSRIQQLKRLERIQTVMEIGTGSGVPITYLSQRLLAEKPRPSHHPERSNGDDDDDDDDDNHQAFFSVIATDLNPLALEFAKKTADENGVVVASDLRHETEQEIIHNGVGIRSIDFVECDLATPLLETMGGKVDVLVFNPPYVPTEDSEISGSGIEISWAGGKDGRRIIDRALPQIEALLTKPNGVCYMITVDDNLPSEMASLLREHHGLNIVPLVRRRARNEYLSVQKISWI